MRSEGRKGAGRYRLVSGLVKPLTTWVNTSICAGRKGRAGQGKGKARQAKKKERKKKADPKIKVLHQSRARIGRQMATVTSGQFSFN